MCENPNSKDFGSKPDQITTKTYDDKYGKFQEDTALPPSSPTPKVLPASPQPVQLK
jgi:hypothetical protein